MRSSSCKSTTESGVLYLQMSVTGPRGAANASAATQRRTLQLDLAQLNGDEY
jgi:hypothetical protein